MLAGNAAMPTAGDLPPDIGTLPDGHAHTLENSRCGAAGRCTDRTADHPIRNEASTECGCPLIDGLVLVGTG